MKRKGYHAFVCLVLLCCTGSVYSQSTTRYTDPYLNYESGLELLANKKYATAQMRFEQAVAYEAPAGGQESFLYRAESEYYAAMCAVELENPDAERMMLAFVHDYPGHAFQGSANFQLGRIYFRKRKYDSAIDWFAMVDEYDLTAAERDEYRFQYGYSLFTRKKLSEAKELFKPLKDKEGPYYLSANYYYGFILYFENEYEDALTCFKVVEDHPVYSQVVPYYFANIFYSQGKYREVVAYTEPLMSNNRLSYYNELNQILGKAYFNLKQYDKALPYLEYYLEKNRRETDADRYQVAFTRFRLDDPSGALELLDKIGSDSDTLAQHKYYLSAQCYLSIDDKPAARNAFQEAAAIGHDKRVKELATFQFAKLSYELGYYPAAVNTLTAYLEEYPNGLNYSEVQTILAESLLRTKNYEQAMEVLEGIPLTSNTLKRAYQKVAYYSGVNAFNNKNYNKAYPLFNKALEQTLDGGLHAATYFWLGEIDYAKEDYGTAIINQNKFREIARTDVTLPDEVRIEYAHYTIGYSYFRMSKFDVAVQSFERVIKNLKINKTQSLDNEIAVDATLRTADCYFMTKNYEKADKFYNRVAVNAFKGSDYALYQQGMLNGLLSKNKTKIKVMKDLITRYDRSIYVDDAMYEIANTHFLMGENEAAITGFKDLLTDKPNSPYTVKAYLKLGLIYYNLNNLALAEEYYRKAYELSPTTAEGAEAKDALKDIAEETGDVDGLEGMVDASERDSISFNAAMNKYNREEYATAVTLFDAYMREFPKGFFKDQVRFYRGESNYKQEKYAEALKDYRRIIDENRLRFLESALLRAAWIEFYLNEDYARANEYYTQLYNVASYKENSYVAMKGLLRTSYLLNDYDEVILNGERILSSDMVTQDERIEAHFYSAKAHLAKGDINKAYGSFESTAELTTNETGVESRFIMADILFQQNKLELSKSKCLEIINELPAYEEWVIRSYILLADIAAAKGEFAQAKASLRSIIDNYQGDQELIDLAVFKLEQIEEMERNNRRTTGEDEDEEDVDPDELEFNKGN